MLALLIHSKQNVSVHATDSESLSPPFDASEVFSNVCRMPNGEQPESPASTANPVSTEVIGGDVASIRSVADPYPSFTGVVIDAENNLAMMSDANKKSLLVYARGSGSKSFEETRPLRQIIGPSTLGGYFSSVMADTARREIYAVNNDIEDNMVVFPYDAVGDVKPKRVLAVPHGAWGLALSKARDEIAMTIQDSSANAVVMYKREAKDMEGPVRVIRGRKTGLADPHGVHFDDANQELIVANWGSWNVHKSLVVNWGQNYSPKARLLDDLPGGAFDAPSITVYPAAAEGEVPPIRKIQGAATQLNWPTGIDLDPVSHEIAVANNGDNSVLLFPRTGTGEIKPARIIRGARTGIDRPMAVAIDSKNSELWVANFGNHSAVIFDLKATGNVAPKRVIRNAPAGTPNGGFGNPMSVAYDPKREELLVPN
jgi:DNA-binding beta-propeller fold protein YncE